VKQQVNDMNSNSTTELDDEVLENEVLEPERPRELPYTFAKRNGVVLERESEGKVIAHYKKGLQPAIANEVNRFLRAKVAFQHIEDDEFERLLALQYDNSGAGASAMMDDLGEELDLNDVADSLPEPEDLLESEDDAPIIRLINAILTQAMVHYVRF